MPNIQSAKKRLRSSERRRLRNKVHRGKARTAIKKARHLIAEGRLEEARQAVHIATRALDNAAQKGIIHKNNAARRKSRLVRQLNKLEHAS